MAPVMALLLSDRVYEILTGQKIPFTFRSFIHDVIRGIVLSVRNMFMEFALSFFFWAASLYLSLLLPSRIHHSTSYRNSVVYQWRLFFRIHHDGLLSGKKKIWSKTKYSNDPKKQICRHGQWRRFLIVIHRAICWGKHRNNYLHGIIYALHAPIATK